VPGEDRSRRLAEIIRAWRGGRALILGGHQQRQVAARSGSGRGAAAPARATPGDKAGYHPVNVTSCIGRDNSSWMGYRLFDRLVDGSARALAGALIAP